jgi:hypothetical protein
VQRRARLAILGPSTSSLQRWALLRESGSDRLEKQPTDLRQSTSYFGDRTLQGFTAMKWFFILLIHCAFMGTIKATVVADVLIEGLPTGSFPLAYCIE